MACWAGGRGRVFVQRTQCIVSISVHMFRPLTDSLQRRTCPLEHIHTHTERKIPMDELTRMEADAEKRAYTHQLYVDTSVICSLG